MNRNKDNREKRGRKGDWQGVRGGCHRVRQGNYVDMSHFSHGLTADHVLIHVDTDLGAKDLRFRFVSRPLLSK
jgi:hypothetical protein